MKGYESYKDSGLNWVGNIPNHWTVSSIRYNANVIGRIGYRGYTVEDIVSEGEGAISLSPSNIQNQTFDLKKRTYISFDKYEESPEIKIFEGDVLLVKTASVGKVALVADLKGEKATINPQLVVFKEILIDRHFFYYYLISNDFQYQIDRDNYGGVVGTLTQASINSYRILIPKKEEQTQIAAFLDYKTNLIDATIEKKKRLIALLKEKRQAVINEAVTKGLNPNAPMKDSGVEWLGEIPEHWEVKKLKYSVNFISEKASNINRGIALEDITSWTGKGNLRDTSHFEGDLILFEKGDVLFSKLRPYLAKVYMAHEEGGAVGELMVLRPKLKIINQEFLYNRLISKAFIDVVDGSTYGAKMPRASISYILDLKFGVPTLIEQLAINDYINKIIVSSNKLSEKLEKAIEKLQTYRQSLISEAVTGKIDVRDWQPPKK